MRLTIPAALSVLMMANIAAAQDYAEPMAASTPQLDRNLRPTPRTLGFGLGMNINSAADLTQPNTAGVRFVLSDGFILEPTVRLTHSSTSVDTPGAASSASVSTTTFGVGAMARKRLASRGPVDLAGLGGASLGFSSTDVMNDTTNTSFSLLWGLGLSWYFNPAWALSLDVTNPIFSLNRQSVDGFGGDTVTTNWTAGAVWDATQALLMLYFYM